MIKKASISLNVAKKVTNLSLDVDRASGIMAERVGFMTLDRLELHRKEGRIRAYGVSNWKRDRIKEAIQYTISSTS